MSRPPAPAGRLPAGRQGFSLPARAAFLDRFQRETFDLVIVGGGINGAGIARDAAMRGLSVALLEKGDFAAGTSSKSSKMVHGGLRYLKTRQVHLVREALRERGVLLRIAPHLVHPFPYILPVYEGGRDSRLKLKLGLLAYDLLAGFRRLEHHRALSREQLLRSEPTLRPDGLRGGFRYLDCLVDDARLTLATVRSAALHGAVAVNYAEVTGLERDAGRVTGVHFRDRLDGRTGIAYGRVVVNAAGPWVDQVRAMGEVPPILRPTKGIHLVLPHSSLALSSAVAFPTPDDRMIFAVPYGDYTYVGTTDTDYRGSPDDVRADAADVEYLLAAASATFAQANVSPSDVISVWAGVRPLVYDEGAPSDVPRDYEIEMKPEGLVTIAGGKLTTYRAMAQALVDRVLAWQGKRFGWSKQPCRTAETPLPGGDFRRFQAFAQATVATLQEGWGLSPPVADRLVRTYGTEYVQVLAYAQSDRRLLQPLAPGSSVLRAEAVYAAAEEMAITLEDFLARRTDLMLFDRNHGLEAAPEAARLMGDVLGWGRRQQREQVERYRDAVTQMAAFAPAEGGSASGGSEGQLHREPVEPNRPATTALP
ncbi:MAG: glycerol-3-phosphate dehydrogenase [Chloroflexota bacterium]|nr:glycerol-3-phosphate dehydrogenase [Chloroflexota bacterium]